MTNRWHTYRFQKSIFIKIAIFLENCRCATNAINILYLHTIMLYNNKVIAKSVEKRGVLYVLPSFKKLKKM